MGRTGLIAALLLCGIGVGCGSTGTAPIAALVASPPALAGPAAIADPTLDRGSALLDAGQWEPARLLLVDWLVANPHAPDRDRGIFLMARYYLATDNVISAFYQYDELLDNLPDSPLYYPALENQYRIADALLNGYSTKFLWFRVVSYEDQAIDMLYRVQERSPGSPLAELALWRTAEYYYSTSQFDVSSDVYLAYIRSYPRSPKIPRAMIRRAFASYAQFRGVRFDATPLIDARSQFEDIIARYPSLAAEDNLAIVIDKIDKLLAAKMLDVARFYIWTGKPGAAVYTYRSLIDIYPNSREAQTASVDLKAMPAWALAQAAPPTTEPEDLTTPNPPPGAEQP